MTATPAIQSDVVIVGSGAAGLATAVTAAWLGLSVTVLEKDRLLGGTSAWSGGWLWIPRNPLAVAAGIAEPIEAPLAYLRHELGAAFDATKARRFLEQGPRMVAFFRNHTRLDFVDGNAIPDFHHPAPGSRAGGRSVCAAPFDGRELGARVTDLAPPLELVSPFGMGIASGADLRHFLFATRTLVSFRHVAGRLARHARDVVRHGRGMHLVNGNALIARLLASADDLGVRIETAMPVGDLIVEDGRVAGVVATSQDGTSHVFRASHAVVLATGGFPHDVARKAAMFPHAPTGREHHSAAPDTNTGDGLRLGELAGGRVRHDLSDAGAWAPVSLVPRADGSTGRFPHLVERAKPGLIMVRRNGRRFANEADSYHDVMKALFAATPAGEPHECWLIADLTFVRRYGLGRVRPWPFPHAAWLANGYLRRGATIADLAREAGISPEGLAATVEAFNDDAASGLDSQFRRGESAYNRIQGEAGGGPNLCVAPIMTAPYFAVRVVPGSLGTFAGLATDAEARVLDADDRPIDGLYAVGNDMSSIMGGRYPAGGITLGPAMTFGYIAAHHMAGLPLDGNKT